MLVDSASGQLAISLGIRGPNYAPVSACATGSHAVGEGAEIIRRGDADAILAGGTEACIHPLILAGFTAMRGLAAEEEHPPRASRPFDATRAGFVMGEGACVLVLEELEGARARGATIYAEVLGYGTSNDAYHMAAPEPEAIGVAEMMRSALARAEVDPARVGYVNAHGTSTPLGDAAETKAIKDVFGDHAHELAVSSTKSVMGHCFGAAGAIEAMMCVLAVHEGVLPPTINYENPDPVCDLDYVPNASRETEVDVLSRSRTRWASAGTTPACSSAAQAQEGSTTSGVSSSSEPSTTSASATASPGGKCRFGIATQRMPAAFAERMPLCESSIATHARGLDAEPARRLEVDVGRRLAARDLLGRDGGAEERGDPARSSTRSISSRFDDDARPSANSRREPLDGLRRPRAARRRSA